MTPILYVTPFYPILPSLHINHTSKGNPLLAPGVTEVGVTIRALLSTTIDIHVNRPNPIDAWQCFPISDHMLFPRVSFLCLMVACKRRYMNMHLPQRIIFSRVWNGTRRIKSIMIQRCVWEIFSFLLDYLFNFHFVEIKFIYLSAMFKTRGAGLPYKFKFKLDLFLDLI